MSDLVPAPTHSERNIALDSDQTVISCGKCGRVLLIIACRNCNPGDGASLEATVTWRTDAAKITAAELEDVRMKINGPEPEP